MVTYLPRSAWGARPSRGGTALSTSAVEGEALHWPGMAKPIDATGAIGQRRVASALRGWQNYHMDGRGWSDIAYQIAIDQAGRAWTLRGLNIRSGANGNADVNRRFGAFLLVLAPGEKPSAAMIATTKAVIADFRKRFPKARSKPYGHRDVRPAGTDCPGPLAYAAINAGTFTPGTAPSKPAPSGGAGTPPTATPSISLAACQYSARHNGQYLPNGTDDVVNVKAYLVRHNYAEASDSFRTAYMKFQRHLGYDGADADGIPGKTSLQILCNSAKWRLVP
ncbi:MAG TPA: hypothetical protein VIQ30_14090 [Pseudonocardia sp.]